MRPLLLVEDRAEESKLAVLFLNKGIVNVPKCYGTGIPLLPCLYKRIVQVEEHLYELTGLFCKLDPLSPLLFVTLAFRVNIIEDGTRFGHTANTFLVIVFLVKCNNLCLHVRPTL